MNQFGETPVEVNQFLDQEMQKGYLEAYSVENPKIPGKQVKCLRLKRDSNLVVEALLPSISKEAEH